ncbi:MAG: Lar family restriction alleviation protein [Pirellulales bacterium]
MEQITPFDQCEFERRGQFDHLDWSKAKPCPFCGSRIGPGNNGFKGEVYSDTRSFLAIFCLSCGASGPTDIRVRTIDDAQTQLNDALEGWNRRCPQPPKEG